MMKRHTVEQLLNVFRLFRERYARGEPLHKSYREAVREVAKIHGVTYQTIGDGCRRRLKLNDIRELYELLSRWMDGYPDPLVEQLKTASDPSIHDEIVEFFGPSSTKGPMTPPHIPPMASEGKFTTFSVRLPERDARMLRALAEIDGVSSAEMLGDLVKTAVAERMKRLAQALLRDSEASTHGSKNRQDIPDILRDHEAELRRLGVEHVSVFGSAARGDADESSDVDLAVSLSPDFSKGGFDYFGRFEALRERLTQMLGRPVDLIEEPVEKVRLREQIDKERAVAF